MMVDVVDVIEGGDGVPDDVDEPVHTVVLPHPLTIVGSNGAKVPLARMLAPTMKLMVMRAIFSEIPTRAPLLASSDYRLSKSMLGEYGEYVHVCMVDTPRKKERKKEGGG